MANLTVRNVPEKDYAEIQLDARRNRRSINAEILSLFADKADMNRRRRHAVKAMKRIDKIREGIAKKYPNQPDSVDLIREDRDNDEPYR
jgi:plasmid stability protein